MKKKKLKKRIERLERKISDFGKKPEYYLWNYGKVSLNKVIRIYEKEIDRLKAANNKAADK